MTDTIHLSPLQGTELRLANDGGVVTPTDPREARARLDILAADPGVVDALLNPKNPSHGLRMTERAELLRAASKAPGALPATPKV